MTYVMTDHLAHRQPLSDPQQAATSFDEAIRDILPHGGSGQSLWLGRQDTVDELRVDIDVDAGRAALTWLPDRSIGIELQPGPSITVMSSVDEPLITIPGAVAR